jgi:hypothetical protein
MPYPNEIAARIRDPKDFMENSFKRQQVEAGIDVIMGKLKEPPSVSMTAQAYRFKTGKYSSDQAKQWLKEHSINPLSFEPVSTTAQSEES